MEIKKVDDAAKPQPVDDIADRAADDQADGDREKRHPNTRQPENQQQHDQRGADREHEPAEPGAVEQAEADPVVAGQYQVEERGSDGAMGGGAPGFAEIRQHHCLARLVEHRGNRRGGKPATKHHSAADSAALAPRSITSAQRRQRSAWPGTWPTAGRTRQQRSQRAPVAGFTRTPMSATSGKVNASADGAPASTVPAEVMHNSARSTSRSIGNSRSGTKISTAACRLEPIRLA